MRGWGNTISRLLGVQSRIKIRPVGSSRVESSRVESSRVESNQIHPLGVQSLSRIITGPAETSRVQSSW
jgi:hypothetical protein